jgi:hypothetical protein
MSEDDEGSSAALHGSAATRRVIRSGALPEGVAPHWVSPVVLAWVCLERNTHRGWSTRRMSRAAGPLGGVGRCQAG